MAAGDPTSGARSTLEYQEAIATLGQRTLESAAYVRIEKVDAETEVGSPPRIDGDPGRPRQLFRNPLDNASTRTDDRTRRISVFAEYDGLTWKGPVRDRDRSERDGSSRPGIRSTPRSRGVRRYRHRARALSARRRAPRRSSERSESTRGAISVDSDPSAGPTFPVAVPTSPDHDSPSDD
ncbi:hypothetical protein A6E15_12700 [Natrinema saccharevitans]|uniref:Uncharacterized protein n=1 Tax=Natrinema saccharevitans TaxID=301967 RepID=A0A1S8AYT4_9EURY|nr:hypothetical protein A6E15_12700 [Natrinema saccharevitans]